MLKLVTQMTDEELRKEDYDLELESQHYDYQADVHGDADGYYELTQADISFRRLVISIEERRRWDARRANEQAEEWAYDRMVEA